MAQSYAFTISGIEPPDLYNFPEPVRRRFWQAVVNLGLTAKDSELAAGLDRFGNPLHPIAESTRKHRRSFTGFADPGAPPLIPAYAESRTRILLAGRALKDRAQFFWRRDPVKGKPWGRTLAIHRKGGKRLPVRDVIGLSPKSVAKVKRQSWKEWEAIKKGAQAEAVQRRPGRETAPQFSGRIAVTGRTDLENAVFAEGGGQKRAEAALAAGTSSGFMQFKPPRPTGLPPAPKPPQPAPKPTARPRPVPQLVPAVAEPFRPPGEVIPPRQLAGLKFVQGERERDAGRKAVTVRVAAIEAAWRTEGLGFHIPPGGGSDRQKYRNARAFLLRALAEGIGVVMPRVTIGEDGSIGFTDGRHRFAAWRDLGARTIQVSTDPAQVALMRRLFGTKRKPKGA